jgi:hypothetical protein
MGSQPSRDPSATACTAGAVTALAPTSGSTGAGARWNHESVDVSSIVLTTFARDSTWTFLRVISLGRR